MYRDFFDWNDFVENNPDGAFPREATVAFFLESEQKMNAIIEQLQRAQDINELILEGSSDYIYHLDVVNDICTFSSKATDVLDLESPTFDNAMNRLLGFIVPEDRSVFLNSYTPFLTGKSKYHTAEYRVITRTGELMWISCRGKGMHDENGAPIMIAGSLLDITEQKRNEEKINQMLYINQMTGLKNRLCFAKDLEVRLKDSTASGSMVYINIRKFKVYNEMFGHQFGDSVLREFSKMLKLFFSDALGIYHLDGDEFMVHLASSKREEVVEKLAPILNILKRDRNVDGHMIYINLYIAVILYPDNGTTVDELMNNANQCLYRMTKEEHSGVTFYDTSDSSDLPKKFMIENELRKDVQNHFNHFRLVYQPLVRIADGVPCWEGAEALLRYDNPEFPAIQQMDMILALEYSGLMTQVGRWVIQKAVQECRKWIKFNENAYVNVNMAAQQLTDGGLIDFIIAQCEEAGIPTSAIHMELTETSMVKNFEVAKEFCQELLKRGIGVALDDFGTGYTGFGYLRELPVNQIKLDIDYVRNIQDNKYNQHVLKFLYDVSNDMQYQIVAEGVETEQEFLTLQEFGIDKMQGYLFQRPMEAHLFTAEFKQRNMR